MRPSATPCGVGKHAFLPTFAAGLGLCKFASGVRLRMRLADERVCTPNWLLYEVSPALHGPLRVVCVHLLCAQCAGPAARILPLLTSRRARISIFSLPCTGHLDNAVFAGGTITLFLVRGA